MKSEKNPNLTLRYIFALSLVAILSTTAFFMLRFAIKEQETGAAIINVAGRQRMLSQRISRFALLYVLFPEDRVANLATLNSDLSLFEDSHNALINGGSIRGLSADEILILSGNPSRTVSAMYFDAPMNLDEQVKTFITETRALIEVPPSELTDNDPHLTYILQAAAKDLLSGLNTVTGQYQKESESAIANLEFLETLVLVVTMLTLIAEAFLIFRPMVQQVSRHTKELQESLTIVAKQNETLSEITRSMKLSAEVSRKLSNILDQRTLITEVVQQLKDTFNYYHVHIYLLDEATGEAIMVGGTGDAGRELLSRGHKLLRGKGLVGRAVVTNAVVLVPNTSLDSNWLPNPLLPETKSEVAVPISVGGQVLGVLDVQHNKIEGLQQSDADLLQSVANQIAIALQNARSYSEIKQNQALLADALSVSHLGNWEYDLEKDLFTFNDQFYSIFRTDVEKIGGYRISSAQYSRDFVHPDDAPLVGSEIQKAIESRERLFTRTLEHRIIFSNGEIGYISVRFSVERDENGRITRWWGVNQDITDRRALEEINRRRADNQEAINKISQKIQSTNTIEEAMQVTARELGRALGMKPTLVSLEPSGSMSSDNQT